MKLLCLLFAGASLLLAEGSATIHSHHSTKEVELTTDPDGAVWSNVPGVIVTGGPKGDFVSGNSLEVRSQWSEKGLHFLLICHYDELHLRTMVDRKKETARLYDTDVAQVFLGPDAGAPNRYFEFEVSPKGEYADAEWEAGKPNTDAFAWNSGFKVAAKLDKEKKIWYAALDIPWSALAPGKPVAGGVMRANFCRAQGDPRTRTYLSWSKTGVASVHKPAAFGQLVLDE